MNTTKAESHEAEKEFSNSREYLMVEGQADKQIPWPENASGFVVAQKELEDFIGNQTLYQAQATTKRFIIVAEAARQIAGGEQFDLNLRLIRFVASEDKSADYQQVMKAMLRAIDQGKEGINAACSTAMHMMDFGFEYMTSYGNKLIYEEGIERMKQTSEKLD